MRAPGNSTSLTFLGKLYGEAELLAFARAYQEATGFHLQHPKLMLASVIVSKRAAGRAGLHPF